ncbi:hypothetical protein PV327_006253 [Microctonus hyperodae]|uniref:Uncharacterized protein n=1 Tax=Microctonus hyperodae TaxID=165561 RepID=A0AA39F3W5_MICHY|nr:hypothetical protein PV327_006253 [Microctonus hyperodae]
MAAMHFNATMVTEDIHHSRHSRHSSYAMDESVASPSSEEARSPIAPSSSPVTTVNINSYNVVNDVSSRRDSDTDTSTSRLLLYENSGKFTNDELRTRSYFKNDINDLRTDCHHQQQQQQQQQQLIKRLYRDDSNDDRINCDESGISQSPDRNINESPNSKQQRNAPGKTSFCIDALLGRATAKPKSSSTDNNSELSVRLSRDSEDSDCHGTDSLATSSLRRGCVTLGNSLLPFVPRNERTNQMASLSPTQNARMLQAIRDSAAVRLSSYDNFTSDPSDLPSEQITKYDRNPDGSHEDDATTDVDVEEMREDEDGVRRTSTASPGSNGTHSPASSPPISPGSEDMQHTNALVSSGLSNLTAGNGNHHHHHHHLHQHHNSGSRADSLGCVGPYGIGGTGVAVAMRQNPQSLLLHSAGPLIHPSGLYYHPASATSAFHSIHKDNQGSLGHRSGTAGGSGANSTGNNPTQHQQQQQQQQQPHHIHPLQLEWLARTGMLYPRLPADLADLKSNKSMDLMSS